MIDKLRVNQISKPGFFASIQKYEQRGGLIGSNAIASSDRAMWLGFVAGLSSVDRTLNPHEKFSFLWERWEEGYVIGLED